MLKDSVCVKVGISIHALVKRATDGGTKFVEICFISIHALVKRATKAFSTVIVNGTISIHALVKRATRH